MSTDGLSTFDHLLHHVATKVSLGIVTLAALMLFGWSFIGSEKRKKDPYKIDACQNPDCIRCQRYAEVNSQAIRRLPWIECSSKRIKEGVKQSIHVKHRSELPGMSPTQAQYPTVLLIPFLPTDLIVTRLHSSACELIRRNHDAIMRDYTNASQIATPSSWTYNDMLNAAGSWKVLHLLNQGAWQQNSIDAFPATAKVLQMLPIIPNCIFGNAFFSVLRRGSLIEPHCGPSNVRHRLQYPLLVPDTTKQSYLKVASQYIRWNRGQPFVFDDSLTHSAVYTGCEEEQERVVLIVDLWHPDLTMEERSTIQQLYPSKAR